MKKRFLSMLLGITVAASMMAGCGSSKTATETSSAASTEAASAAVTTEAAKEAVASATKALGKRPEGGYTFGYTCMDGTNPFFVILEKTIKEEVEKNGDKLV